MSKSFPPQRAVWPKLLPELSLWSTLVGMLLGGISLILTGVSDLNWWVKVGILLVSLLIPTFAYMIWTNVRVIWQRVMQYDLLYDGGERAAANNQQLQENFTLFLQTLTNAGLHVFRVTGIEWGNPSPFLVIACDRQLPIGSKLFVVHATTLDELGHFVVVQAIRGGYFAREEKIKNSVWWGLLHEEMAKYAHPRITNALAIWLP